MNKFLRILLYVVAMVFATDIYSQTVDPVTVNNGVVTLKGKGKLGTNKDAVQWRRYKFARSGNFYLSAYFRSLSNSSSSFTGIAFRNETTGSKTDGGIPMVGLFFENDTLKLKTKLSDNSRIIDVVALPGVKIPGGIKIEKNNNNLKVYNSTSPENSTSPVWNLVQTVNNVFTGWTNITQNFGTGNAVSSATAIVSNISFGTVTADATNPCSNGGTFNILSVTNTTGNLYAVQFNASGLSSVNVDVKNSSNISVRNYTTSVTANPTVIDVGTQALGTYTLTFTGQSCSGTTSKAFTISSTQSNSPVASSSITPVYSGSSVTFSVTGCSSNSTINWYRKQSSTVSATLGTSNTLTLSTQVAGDKYYATCAVNGTTTSSNEIDVLSPTSEGGGGSGQEYFVNNLKTVPTVRTPGYYDPSAFPKISVTKSIDPVLGFSYPNWGIGWQVEADQFRLKSRKVTDLGIAFMYDIIPNASYGDYGTERCLDYLSFFHPNNSDATCLKPNSTTPYTFSEFTSRIPFLERAWSTYGQSNATEWDNRTIESVYDEGINATGAIQLGWGDRVGNRTALGIANADIETNYETGSPKHQAFLFGMSDGIKGYAFSQYSAPLNIVFLDPSKYPTTNSPSSGYPTYIQKVDGTNDYGGNGTLGVNNIPSSSDWSFSNTLTITSRGIINKTIADYTHVLPCAEVSSYADATYRHGQTIIWDNNGSTRVINKFGTSPNAEHIVAKVIYSGETNKWYVKNKLDNRRVILQSKITCDRGNMGNTKPDGNEYGYQVVNESLKFAKFDREYAFNIGAFTFFTGCDWNVWDRNVAGHDDSGYDGVFGIINYLNQKRTVGSESKSFIELMPRFNFLEWESEISYDNGTTWLQEKANQYVLNSTHIPQRQVITSDGIWGGFLARPEKTEAKSCILRVKYNNQYYTYTVTPDMWETVDYDYRNTALNQLPDSKKSFHIFMIKLGSSQQPTSSTVSAPTISSSPAIAVVGTSTTFSASGCSGTVKWWTGDAQVATGNSYTVSSPVINTSYTATCTVGANSSTSSNTITVQGQEVPVFLFWGESNAGTRNATSTASSTDLGFRTGVRILNNNTNQLEAINIPSNSSYGEWDCTPGESWGWEVPAANYFQTGALNATELNIIKVAQGGSVIGQWNDDIEGGYFQTAEARINAVKTKLASEGKTPKWYIFYSQGINNATTTGRTLTDAPHYAGTGITYLGNATSGLLPKILNITSQNAKIVMTTFGSTQFGDYLNAKINEICNNSGGKYISVSATGLTVQPDQLHWDATSTKTIFNRMLQAHGL